MQPHGVLHAPLAPSSPAPTDNLRPRAGHRQSLACGKAAQHCQFWLPPALLQAVPDPREHPAVSWLCTRHYGHLTDTEIVTLRVRRSRGGTAAR